MHLNYTEHQVGIIEGFPVIYVAAKDVVFCKNTCVSYPRLLAIWKSAEDRHKLEDKSLIIQKDDFFVTLGCLTATKEQCSTILHNIKKIKRCQIKSE